MQNKTIKRGSQAIQSYVWDFNVAYMEEGEKEFTYLQDELGSTIRLLEQGGESQAIYGYDEFGEDTYRTQGYLQPFGYTGYRYDNVADILCPGKRVCGRSWQICWGGQGLVYKISKSGVY